MVKYPTDSLSFCKRDPDIKKHKLGYYASEQDDFLRISAKVGTYTADGQICRHPLTYLLEAADDIAYATADLEDAFEKRLFALDDFIKSFRAFYSDADAESYKDQIYYSDILINQLCDQRGEFHTQDADSKAFRSWLSDIRRWLMYVAVYRFSYKYRDIMNGTYNDDLFTGTYHALTIKVLKSAMGEYVFDTPGILKLELSAQTILSFLLDKFVHAVLYKDKEYQDAGQGYIPSKADKKYLSIFSDNYKTDYGNAITGNEAYDLYLRLLMRLHDPPKKHLFSKSPRGQNGTGAAALGALFVFFVLLVTV